MSDPTDRLATVRAALDPMLRVWPGSLDVRGYVDETGNDAAAVIDVATGETIATCDNEDRDDHATPVEDARAIVALRNAAPAIAALADECERLRATVSALDLKVADMSDTIANERTRRALEREEFRRALEMTEGDARRHLTSFAREAEINADQRASIATLEAELAQARAHRCGGIVLSAEDADRIAALLEEQPGPTPAMLALFDKAKEE